MTGRLVLSEYNPLSFQANGREFNGGGLIEQYGFAQEVLHNLRFFLEQPDIAMVNWAQFNDPLCLEPQRTVAA